MREDVELKTISPGAVPRAIERAKHYRLLNQPAEADSICRDILHVEPDNQEAIIVLSLALTDQIIQGTSSRAFREAQEFAAKLTDPYEHNYYLGIVYERRARAQLQRGKSQAFAYTSFREAMSWYEEAHDLAREGDDDAILRWNSCVRAIRNHGLRPRHDEGELPLE